MKSLFLILIFSSFYTVDWIDETENLVETIQRESKLVKTKTKSDEGESYTVVKHKYLHYNYIQVVGNSQWIDTFNFSFFSAKQFVFTVHYFLQADRISKNGAQIPNCPNGDLYEDKFYFKSKKDGIHLSRSIEYTDKNNRDSLVKILQNMPFDTLKIGNIEYLRSVRMYKLYK